MDVRSWKKILMQWISECGFIELNFFNIEQSDIDEFFKNFCIHHIKAGCRDVEAGTITEYKNGVIGFLKEYYPDFQPHTDDTNSLSPADYLYVYSLLLHYSCVKSPDTFFHEKCQKLSEHAQQCIAWFFNQLLDCEKIDKESLRRAIADVGITQGGSPRQYDSFSSSGSGSGSANSTSNGVPSPQFIAPLSPVKTPRKGGGTIQRISPTTPKSFLLEERTRELYTLRAQLETERYEKGLLEVQIKQYEDKMAKLNQDHKKLKQQIQDLKNDLLNRNSEITSHRDSDEHIKRRLCKELSQKEQEICRLTDHISTLSEEKGLAQDKLTVAEKQIIACRERIKEQEYRNDEMAKELEKKSCTIKYLTDSKAELEHYITEMRSQSSNNRSDLNSSLDSSNSISSPENLGRSVIDVKLREKENENCELREELMKLKQTCTRLATHIQTLSLQYTENFEIDVNYVSVNRDDPAENFIIFANCVDQLGKLYKDEQNLTMKLQDDVKMLHERNDVLKHNVEDLGENVITLKGVLERLEQSNSDLEVAKVQLEEKLKKCNGEINQLQQEKFVLAEKLSTLTNEYDMHWINCESEKSQQKREVDNYKMQIEEQNRKLTENYEKNVQLQEEIESLQLKVQSAQEKLLFKTTGFEMEIKALNEKLLNQKMDLEAHEKTEKMVKEKYEELIIAYEEMKGESRETDSYLTTMRNDIASKEGEMERLGNEIICVCKKNRELEERINHLMNEVKNTKQSSDMTINKRNERIKEIEGELKTANETIENMKIELRSTQCEYESSKSDLEQMTIKIKELSQVLNLTVNTESEFTVNFSNIVLKIKDIIEQNTKIAKQIENLEFANMEKQTKIEVIENQMQKAWQEKQSVTDKVDTLLKERDECSKNYERERVELEERLADFNAKNMCKLAAIEMEKEAIKKEISNLNGKHSIKENNEKSDNESDVTEKIRGYQEQLEQLTVENNRLLQDFEALKEQHSYTEMLLKDLMSNNVSGRKDKANEDNIDGCEKLPLKEVHLRDTEQVLNGFMQERVVGGLQMAKEQPSEKDKQVEDRVAALERSQSETILNLRNKLKETVIERDEAKYNIDKIQAQLNIEKRERVVLLNSLESTSDRLKELMDERINNNTLQVQCAELQNKLTKANENIRKLESQVVEQETELHLALDEYQQECDKWNKKVNEVSYKLEDQSSDIESIVTAIAEVISVMEKHLNDFKDEEFDEANNFFEDCELDCNNQYFQKMKKKLNRLLCVLMKLDEKVKKAQYSCEESKEYLDNLTKTNITLVENNKDLKAEVEHLQKELQSDTKCIESKFGSEIKRLLDNVRNLENVNESMTGDNAKLQSKVTALEEKVANFQMSINMLTEKEKSSKNDLEFKDEIITKMKEEESRQKEKLNHIEELKEKCTTLETSLKDKTKDFECKLTDLQKKLSQQQEKCAGMEIEYQHKTLEIAALESKSHDCFAISQQFEAKIKDLVQQKQEAEAEIVEVEQKYAKLNIKYDKMVQECEEHKYQYENTYCEVVRLNGKVEAMKVENLRLEDDLQATKRELLRANENISHLIQQNSSVRMEKDSLIDEHQLLKKEMERVASYRITADLKLQDIAAQTKVLEEKLFRAESNLNAIRAKVKVSKESDEKLIAQNAKLVEASESATKRIESLSFKLGELQALHSKTERDNEKLTKQLEANATKCDTLQKDKDVIQRDYENLRRDNDKLANTKMSMERDNENLRKELTNLLADSKALKERLNKSEQVAADLSIKIELIEGAKEALEEVKQTLEASEKDNKLKIMKLEKLRDINEEKIRNLNQDIRSSEQSVVRLNHEIGSLNIKINALIEEKKTAHSEHIVKIEELSKSYQDAAERIKRYEILIDELKSKAYQLENQNSIVSKQLSEVTESLQESKEKCELLQFDMEQLQADFTALRAEKATMEENYKATCATLLNIEMVNKQLSAEKDQLVGDLEMKIADLNDELAIKNAELANVQQEVELLRKAASSKTENLAELDELRVRVNVMKETIEKEQAITTQLRLDNQILQAKYREAKQRITDEAKAGEERVKENRLEMEGKLEKMKNKMKTLYNEEITKMKSKQERETAHLKSELDVLKAQNTKFEEHVRKLSSQIGRLNDRNLDYQKENALLSTKLKHLEDNNKTFKRPSSLQIRTTSAASSVAASTNVDTNFGMEDEEGEIFNNTYLTDLKNGRMSELMNTNICPEELQYRNSLLPPHLKSTYAAQYDHGLPEDDMKDGPHSLDDSMLALLSTTESGNVTRKKIIGATHYKRPGPPTPSKHGGRLSFGGSTEPVRAILKETHDDDNIDSVSSSKTPARFSFFTSRFSMGNVKDEQSLSTCSSDLRRTLQKRHFQWIEMAEADTVCTSTPRKSRTCFEQRRLLDQMSQSSASTVERHIQRESVLKMDKQLNQNDHYDEQKRETVPSPRTSLAALKQRRSRTSIRLKRRMSNRRWRESIALESCLAETDSVSEADAVHTPQIVSSDNDCRSRKRLKRVSIARPSINLHGNMFSRCRTPKRILVRDLTKKMRRFRRHSHFNKLRNIATQACRGEKPSTSRASLDETVEVGDNFTMFKIDIVPKDSKNVQHACNRGTKEFLTDDKTSHKEANINELEEYLVIEPEDCVEISDSDDFNINIRMNIDSRIAASLAKAKCSGSSSESVVSCEKNSLSMSEFNDERGKHFEKLLLETESYAPFEVRHRQFSINAANNSAFDGDVAVTNADVARNTTAMASITATTLATQNCTTNSGNLSRTIYGASVIFNRRMPNINTMQVRKSSIYIRNQDMDASNEIVLVTDQTINIVDLLRMWKQMSNAARCFLAFSTIASCFSVFWLVVLLIRN